MRRLVLLLPLAALASWAGACGFATAGLGPAAGGGGSGGVSTSTTSSASSGSSGCPEGQKPCGNACVPTTIPSSGCGEASCAPCPSAHGTAACTPALHCALACDQGFGDCDGDGQNGCEADLQSDPAHCGTCGGRCDAPAVCSGGQCVLSCGDDTLDCNHDINDGCEVHVLSDAENCGACGHACSNAGGVGICSGAVCSTFCDVATLDCNGNPDDGCEVTPFADPGDPSNCGGCNNVCQAGFACSLGFCTCLGDPGACSAGAAPGSYDCVVTAGGDRCICMGMICEVGQRCLANGTCG